ncbi:hypothetical protein B0H19DRAFT_1083687 [Mycena capillaripes]|nr:hypothetical protein B0H19DRAFT_1083687 [Mycena capillaripes]
MEKSSVLSTHETRRARAQSPDGTPAQRVERVREGWGRRPFIHRQGRDRDTRPPCPPLLRREMPAPWKAWKRQPQKFRIPIIKKQGKRRRAKNRHSPKQLLTSTVVCSPGRHEQRSAEKALVVQTACPSPRSAAPMFQASLPLDARRGRGWWRQEEAVLDRTGGRPVVPKGARPAAGWETEEEREGEQRERARRSGGRWTEELCVWCANGRKRGEGASTKETQSAMEGKYGGRAQRNGGKRRRRMDDEGQNYEGKREARPPTRRPGTQRPLSRARRAPEMEEDDGRVKEEVELLEKGSRRRRAGWRGGTESRACRSCASIVVRIRALAQHQRNATLPV